MIGIGRSGCRGLFSVGVVAAVLSTLLAPAVAVTPDGPQRAGNRLIGAVAAEPGVTPSAGLPGQQPRSKPAGPMFTLRQVDKDASVRTRTGFAPDGEGGGYGCTPYVDWDFGDVGEDAYLEETVTAEFYGEVECNFYLWSISAAAGVFDRSPSFNGESFDDDVIAVGPTYYTEDDYYAYSYGGFGVSARLYNGARRVEPAVEMILEAPEGFVWDDCEPIPGLRYLEPCDGLGTNELYALLGAYGQDTGLTKACRDQQASVDPEQARVPRIYGTTPASTQILQRIPAIKDSVTAFKRELCGVSGGATAFAAGKGQALWDTATAAARAGQGQGDDRPLYWARLSMTRALAQRRPESDNAAAQTALDRASRGMNSDSFNGGGRKVFVSGFDPFSLDDSEAGSILHGNPSAASVLPLDDEIVGGAEVQVVIFPVRYADFAAGLVEQVFRPHLQPGGQRADLITTVSQNNDPAAFDLEFYNGRRRSTNSTDNLAVPGGGTRANPIVPGGMPGGAEFVETTLPVDRMLVATARVNTEIRERTSVPPRPTCTSDGVTQVCSDGPTIGSTAVEGGGGSYLSNEIAYRVTRLRDELGAPVQAGHVHTPELCLPVGGCAFDADRNRIRTQYRQILEAGIAAPGVPAVQLTVDRTSFVVGESPVYTVVGGPSAPIQWSGARNGAVVERDIDLGHTTDGTGRWTGSWHQWQPGQEGDWIRYARVGGRLATVSMTVEPAQPLPPYVAADFDADDRTDIAVWRPSNGRWYVQPSGGGYTEFAFGMQGDIPVDADFSGDGRTDYGVYRPADGTWYTHTGSAFSAVPWGLADDVPVPADYDRDGRADVAVWRPSNATWYVLPSSGAASYQIALGNPGDRPVPGDYDGDDRADLAVFQPASGTWLVRRSSDRQVTSTQFGLSKDITVAADYDGDGRTDIAVFRGTDRSWRILQSSTGTQRVVLNGSRLTRPAPGDYDGDGRADFAVFTPGTGSWQILHNTGGTRDLTFGQDGDVPVPGQTTVR